jgi:hypothetical protein
MTQPVRMQRCEDWTYKCPPVSSPTVMRTSRTAESLDDERTPADNQPPVAPQYHAAPIDLLRQAPCPTCDQAGRVRLAHPVGTGGRCVRRSTQGVQVYGELSLKSSIDERRPCPIVLAGGSGGGSGDDQLIDRRRPPHLARPAQQVGCYRASSRSA